MFNSLTSCLLFFFIFSFIHPFTCDSSKQDFGVCQTLFQCGNITAGFPFWGGGLRRKDCGHPLLELRCFKNTTSLFISNQQFNVLHLNQTSNTLRLVRKDHLGSFCSSQFTNTTLPQEMFQLLSTYKSHRVFNHCFFDHYYPRRSYKCPRGFIILSENPENHQICGANFTVNVPKSFIAGENEVNMTKFESVLSKGFEVKLNIDEITCQLCLSYPERCGFNKTWSLGSTCRQIHPEHPTATDLHKLCSVPFSCGDQTGLSYPFWISGREDCGHPDFGLNCSREHAEFSISSVKYRILSANYTSGTIRLTRLNSINDPCPQDPIHMSFEENVLPLASTSDLLTIYYDCNEIPESFSRLPTYIKNLDCRNDKTEDDRRDYYVTRSLSPPLLQDYSAFLNHFSSFCSKTVRTPASRITLNTLEKAASTDNLKKALNESFELGVNKDCKMCIGSGGACGYNQTHTATNGFVCYCIDETTNLLCKPTNKEAGVSNGGLSTAAKAGIVIASGLGLLFITGALLLLIRRRRKTQSDQYTSKDLPITSYSSRETSRNPTSTTISYSSNHSLLPSISDLKNGSVYYGVQVFSYEELEEATENFSRELGDGGFGTVYYGMLKDGRAVAVKRLYERSLKRVEQFKNEIEILKSLKHPNLVTLYGCTSRHSRELLLVYEYISNGTLAEHLHGDRAEARSLCWSLRLKVAIETASALSYLHTSGIIHRDIKTTNILLDENYQVKVADFGLSRLFPMDQTHISTAPQGTPGYVDPEYYQCYRLNEKSDVYSFGVVLTELISSKEAVDITRHRHDINLANMALSKIQNNQLHELVDPSLGFEKDPEVKRNMMSVAELAFRCLQQEREVRPSMDEIVEILKGIKDGEKRVLVVKSPDVVDVDGNGGGDDVRLLRHSLPPPISPETDKWTSSSDTAASF